MKVHKLVSLWEILFVLVLIFLSLVLLIYYFSGTDFSFSHKGTKALQEKNFVQAQKYFNQGLIHSPSNPWLHINLALSYDFLDAPDKALKIYNTVSSDLAKHSKGAVFYAYFNQGELNGRLGLLEEAIKNYQKALEFQYKEKIIKTNIELLFQHDQQKQTDDKEEKSENKSEEENQQNDSFSNEEGGQEQEAQQNDSPSNEGSQEQETQQDDSFSNEEGGQEQETQQDDSFSNEEGGQEQENQQNGSSSNEGGQEQEAQQNDSFLNEDKQGQHRYYTEEQEQQTPFSNEEQAILKEIEKQENKARLKAYKRKKHFGDKSKKDW